MISSAHEESDPGHDGSASAGYGGFCFVCHRPFGDDVAVTAEDVVPKWVLKHLGLGNASADLPTGQVVRYSQRKVPCCWDCNQRMSKELELPVSAAFRGGYDAVLALSRVTLFLWLAKVYYGTRFRETGLRTDIRDPDSELLLDHEDLLARNEYLRRCLNLSPASLSFAAQPASMFAFRAGVPKDPEYRFDFFASTQPGVDMVAIRIVDTFIICIFGDNGYWAERLGSIRLVQAAMAGMQLHPVQCTELMLWFAKEAGGHVSSGCWDLVSVTQADGMARHRFIPQFVVERNDVPEEYLNIARVATFHKRHGSTATQQVLDDAAAGRFPSALVNFRTDELVHATCFEVRCPGVLHAAGWETADGSPCRVCGTPPEVVPT